MKKRVKVAVLISGRGSNLESLINACKDSEYPAEISLVVSNNKNAYGLEIAKNHFIETVIIEHQNFSSRQEFDDKLNEIITSRNCQIICLAGFMRVLGKGFVEKWPDRIINIHPSLLPAFKGAKAVEDAINYGVKYSGCTVHYVRPEVDSGPIIEQLAVNVSKSDTKETLAKKILKQEHKIYPKALKVVCKKFI